MSKFCKICGTEADDSALFCAECGARLEQQAEQPTQTAEQPQYRNPYEEQQAEQPSQTVEQPQYQNPYKEQPVQQQPQQNYYQPNTAQNYTQNQYSAQPVQYGQATPVAKQKKPGKGFGIASLVLGIVAIINVSGLMLINLSTGLLDTSKSVDDRYIAMGFSIIISVQAGFIAILALLSLIFGIVSIVKGNRGTAIAGLIMSALSIVACVLSFVIVNNLEKPSWSEILDDSSGYSSELESDLESSLREFDDYMDQYDQYD